MSLFQLNDDCLLYIFRFLDPEDLIAMEQVCEHLQCLAYQFYPLCHRYEWSRKRQLVNGQMIERIGASLREFVYQGIASVDVDCFTAVNRYCRRITSLTLCDVTIDMNLITLLVPVLDHLKKLQIDRYLLIKKLRVEGPLNEGDEPEVDEDVPSDIQCFMLCMPHLTELTIGEPFDKDSFMSHDYLSTLLNLRLLKLNLARNRTFTEFGEYFGQHSFLPLLSLELNLPNDGVTDYDLFCTGLENLKQLEELQLTNLQNKHFWLLIPYLRKIKSLRVLHLNCAQGVIISKSVQRIFPRIENKNLKELKINRLINLKFDFLYSMRCWSYLRSFEIANCEKFADEDLLEICTRVSRSFITMTVRNCSLTPKIVHLLVKISKLRVYNLNFYFYHETQEVLSKFTKQTERTIIQYINVNNFLSE